MIRIVYKDKVEFYDEVSKNARTFYRSDMICKDFESEEMAQALVEAIENPPKLKEDMERFATALELTYSKSALKAELSDTIDTFLKTSNYPPEKEVALTKEK